MTTAIMHYASDDAIRPDYAPDEILPGLWQGGTEDDEVIGVPAPASHYRRPQPFDLVVTLYADALPAPWGVEETITVIRERRSGAALSNRVFVRWLIMDAADHVSGPSSDGRTAA